MLNRFLSLIYAIIMFIIPTANIPSYEVDTEAFNTNYTYVYVHGLGGWGDDDIVNDIVPYWGMFGGSLMDYLNARGFDCVASSVNPVASCWDRACELYAQLTGTRTDYGKHHSEQNGHKRYGPDFTGKALVDKIDAENKINLLGHSFGGATVLQFLDLLADGSAEERKATPASELSELFKGGKSDWVYSVTTLSAPMNGCSAYYIKDEILADENATAEETLVACVVGLLVQPMLDGRNPLDNAGYDMEIDRARSLCDTWETQENVYYFSYACDVTYLDENGQRTFDRGDLEMLFRGSAGRIVKWTGTTPSGYVIDEKWQANDGLVNTYSAIAPHNAQTTDYDANDVNIGIWNVMPIYHGDHMSLQGGMLQNNNIRTFYADHLSMINGL